MVGSKNTSVLKTKRKSGGIKMRVFSIAMMILGLSIVGVGCGEPADDAAVTDEVVADSAVVDETAPLVEVNIDVVVDSTVVVVDSTLVVTGNIVVEEVVEEPAPEVIQ
jgi:hypothetical protein